MKKFANLLTIAAVGLAIYSVIGRFAGSPALGLGLIYFKATTGLLISNTLFLIAIIIKLSK